MVDLITLFHVCLNNVSLVLEMYDLSPKEKYHLKKIKGDLEVYLNAKTVNIVTSLDK